MGLQSACTGILGHEPSFGMNLNFRLDFQWMPSVYSRLEKGGLGGTGSGPGVPGLGGVRTPWWALWRHFGAIPKEMLIYTFQGYGANPEQAALIALPKS